MGGVGLLCHSDLDLTFYNFILRHLRHISQFTKTYRLQQLIIMCTFSLLPTCALSADSYTSINKFYSFISFSFLINAVIILLQCLVLILYLCIHFLSVKCYSSCPFIKLKTVWSKSHLIFVLFHLFYISWCSTLVLQAVGYGQL